mgnify:CR=1 FL=1
MSNNIFDYRNNLEEKWQDLTDFDCLEVRLFVEHADPYRKNHRFQEYICEFLLTFGGPTVRLTIDSRWNCGELFHSWAVDHDGNKKETVDISEAVTDNFKDFIQNVYGV